METYQSEHNQPKDIARNVWIKRPDYPSNACLLVSWKRIVCTFQHGRLFSPAIRLLQWRMKLKDASWFPANRMRTLESQ